MHVTTLWWCSSVVSTIVLPAFLLLHCCSEGKRRETRRDIKDRLHQYAIGNKEAFVCNAEAEVGRLSNAGWAKFWFLAALQKLPPPPPCIEVSFFEPEGRPIKSHTEPIVVGDGKQMITLLKGRVGTSDVFRVSNSDLVPVFGGLKLWEGSIDLVKTLYTEIEEGRLTVKGKRVLELGCGHGLPGIFTGLKGAATIHFQDFNSEVLRYLTVPNAKVNLIKKSENNASLIVRFFAGDWSEVHHLLLHFCNGAPQNVEDCATKDEGCDGYDIILMAETVYALSSLQNLYELIKKCLCRHHGRVYMSGKKHYFGVGGGTRQFISLVEADGDMKASLLAEVADGSSNVREVWKLSYE